MLRQVDRPTHRSPLGIACAEDHLSHPSLHQGTGTHWTGFQGDDQGAVIHPPITPESCGLTHRDQFGMAQRIKVSLTAVATESHPSPEPINDHGTHRYLVEASEAFSTAQKQLHPELFLGLCEGQRGTQARRSRDVLLSMCHHSGQ